MQSRSQIINELIAETPNLAGMGGQMPYAVPDGYFEQLTLQIMKRTVVTSATATPHLQQAVPNGYFENFSTQLLATIQQQATYTPDELEAIAPTLLTISRQMPHYCPEGYFQELRPIKTVQPKAIKLPNRNTFWRIAAAILLLLSAFGIWQMSHQTNNSSSKEIASQAIQNDIDTAMLSQVFANLEDEVFYSSLSDVGVSNETQTALLYYQTSNFEQALQAFSADDLAGHLEELPQLLNAKNPMNL